MSNDRATQALARIDAALARIESAPRATDPALAARYAKLRTAAEAALGELDTIIAAQAR